MNNKPYENLDPNLILSAIDSAGFFTSGSIIALNSYENRVYQIGIEDSVPLIAKFYRPNRWTDAAILEEHQFSLELSNLEIPVVAPIESQGKTLHHYENYSFALFPRWGGHALEPDNLEQLEWMGRFIGRLHAVGACKTYKHRPTLNLQTRGYEPYQFLLTENFIPDFLKENYKTTVSNLLTCIAEIYQNLGSLNMIRIHGDCHLGNVLWNDNGPHIVDLDDSVMGPAVQDLWMLLSDQSQDVQINRILQGYYEFFDFDPRELRLIEVMRTLRMIQYSAWLAKRWEDPAFPLAFPWFNTAHYWQQQLADLQDQLLLLTEATS